MRLYSWSPRSSFASRRPSTSNNCPAAQRTDLSSSSPYVGRTTAAALISTVGGSPAVASDDSLKGRDRLLSPKRSSKVLETSENQRSKRHIDGNCRGAAQPPEAWLWRHAEERVVLQPASRHERHRQRILRLAIEHAANAVREVRASVVHQHRPRRERR